MLKNIRDWFRTAKPEPSFKDFQVQLGVHFEEVSEMAGSIKGLDRLTQSILTQALVANHALALHLKQTKGVCIEIPNPAEFLDAVCDQIVTVTGTAEFYGFDVVGAAAEVDRSNWSKFSVNGKPILEPTGKIGKGPNYAAPNLHPYLP